MSEIYVSLNSALVKYESASLHISDLSIQRGFGIFDFLKTINGVPVFIDDYLDRFFNSIKEMSMDINFNRETLLNNINSLMAKNQIPDSGIKIILTGGYSEDGYTSTQPNLLIIQTPFKLNPDNFNHGINLVSFAHQRQLPSVKTIDYLQAIRLNKFIKENNAQDVLYHNNGQICECPRANIFVVIGRKIITPKTNILKGITRKRILEMQIEGYEIVESDINMKEISSFDEAFVCSSTKNILPVFSIDNHTINQGIIGHITLKLNEKLNAVISDYVN